jgi:DNA primase
MTIDQTIIDQAKRTDLVALVRAKGIELKKNGQSFFGLCPFHADKTPSLSINPDKNLFQCFGCGAAGDAIRFVELFDQVDFKQAVARLTDGRLPAAAEQVPADAQPAPAPGDPNLQGYLERVAAIYENNFAQNGQGKRYLESRGITDAGLLVKHAAGYCNGSLNEILPQNGGIRNALTHLGILRQDGSERFLNCVVLPVYDLEGGIITLYGRHMDGASHKKHLFLPRRPTGLWNGHIIKSCPEIILTESVIDALSVQMAGFANVIAIGGVNGLTDREIMDLKIYRVEKIVLLMDGDEPGIKASGRLKERLKDFSVQVKTLPDGHDPNSYLTAHGPQKLAQFIQSAGCEQDQGGSPEPAASVQVAPTACEPPGPAGFVIACGMRHYRIMSLDRGPNRLKATIRIEHAAKLHIDTLDLYTARARTKFAADLCHKFEQLPETIEADIERIIRHCETMSGDPAKASGEKPPVAALTGRQKKEAQAFGKSKELIRLILEDFVTCGLIGEEANKLLGYIAMTSRKQSEPLSVLILSSSGAGKTALQDAVVNFCPPEDLVKLTNLSGKALFYKEQKSLKHKVLALEEGDGAQDAAYAIRSLISAGVLINETTIKDLATGRLTTMENRVEGPTAVFYTTTDPDVDAETKSRFFVTGIDESREQTKRILAFQREKHSTDEMTASARTAAVIQKHINFQRLLKPVGVKNPFSSRLTYGDDRLQSRRDQPKYLNLIKAVAFLRQMQKQVISAENGGKSAAYIEVDTEDIRIANKLAQEILGRSLDELSRTGRDLLLLLDQMVEKRFETIQKRLQSARRTEIPFTRRDIRKFCGWTNTRVHRYLKELVDLEYVLIDAGRNGALYRYRLAYEGQGKDGSKFVLGLTPVEELVQGS